MNITHEETFSITDLSRREVRWLHDTVDAGVRSIEDEIETTIDFSLNQIESDLIELVKKISDPLFTLFDFFRLSDSVYEEIVNKFTLLHQSKVNRRCNNIAKIKMSY